MNKSEVLMNDKKYLLTGNEEYVDAYDQYEVLAAQELAEYEGALVQTEDGYKASVWLTDDETETVLRLAESRGIPPRQLIQEWVIERIKAASKPVT